VAIRKAGIATDRAHLHDVVRRSIALPNIFEVLNDGLVSEPVTPSAAA